MTIHASRIVVAKDGYGELATPSEARGSVTDLFYPFG